MIALSEMFGICEIPALGGAGPRKAAARSIFGLGEGHPDNAPGASSQHTGPMSSPDPGTRGLRITGDRATLGALQDALLEAEHNADSDVAHWCGLAWRALAHGIQSGRDTVTLPEFMEVPAELEPDEDEHSSGEDYHQ